MNLNYTYQMMTGVGVQVLTVGISVVAALIFLFFALVKQNQIPFRGMIFEMVGLPVEYGSDFHLFSLFYFLYFLYFLYLLYFLYFHLFSYSFIWRIMVLLGFLLRSVTNNFISNVSNYIFSKCYILVKFVQKYKVPRFECICCL